MSHYDTGPNEDLEGVPWFGSEEDLEDTWDPYSVPFFAHIAAAFTSGDEIFTERISQKVYGDNATDTLKAAITRAIFTKMEQDTSYFSNYMVQVYTPKAQIKSGTNYAHNGLYFHGQPSMKFSGTEAPTTALLAALDDDTASTNAIISAAQNFPSPTQWFQHELQTSNAYDPGTNLLTANDPYGVSRTDWVLGDITYNVGPDNWTLNISRTAQEAKFWMEGPTQITEGDTATFTIRSNRPVPVGESVTINFTYTGTAVDATDYTEVASVVMLASTQEITVDIATIDTGNGRNFTITLDSITNTNGAFEMVTIDTPSSKACDITINDGLKITVQDFVVTNQDFVYIDVDFTLQAAAPSGAFQITYGFNDITAVGGTDYDNTGGTLDFAGNLGEVQTAQFQIYEDIPDVYSETFEIYAVSSDDVDSIDIADRGTVELLDNSFQPAAGSATLNHTLTGLAFDQTQEYIILTYHDLADAPSEWFYWLYDLSDTVTYPGLNFEVSVLTDPEMIPVILLRQNKDSLTEHFANEEYRTSKLLMMQMGLDISDFLDGLNDHPDLTKIDDAYVNFAISPTDHNQVISKILFGYWYDLIVTYGLTSNSNHYQATFLEGNVNTGFTWGHHTHITGITDNAGLVDPPIEQGEYSHYIKLDQSQNGWLSSVVPGTGSELHIQYQKYKNHPTEPDSYDEIVIYGLGGVASIKYEVHHQYHAYGIGDPGFTFPLSWNHINELSGEELLEAYQFLLRMDIHAFEIVELEWYETGAFAIFFQFALALLTVATLGLTSPIQILFTFAVQYAIGELIVWVAEATGSAVLAAVVGVVAAIAFSNPSLFTKGQLLQASNLLDLSMDFVDTYQFAEGHLAQQDIEEQIAEQKKKITEEIEFRGETELDDTLEPPPLSVINSPSTANTSAIENIYDYDQLFDYDTIIGRYHENRLLTGVK